MRIAQIVASYHPRIGGVETHVRHLARGCAEAGDDVTVLTLQHDTSPAQEWQDGVRILRFPPTVHSRYYPFSIDIHRYVKSHAGDYDLLHAHNYHTLAGQVAVGSSLPFVFTPHYHGTGHTPFRAIVHKFYRPIGGRQFRAADVVICVSDAERALVASHFRGTAGKTVTVPNGIERRPHVGTPNLVARQCPVVLTVGRLERYKNIDLIIDAFSQLPQPAILIIVGDGPDRARLEQHASAIEPGSQVVFAGQVSDLALDGFFAHADVVTSASDHEAFGLTLADGMAAGARVVASAIPAHAELARLAGTDAPCTFVDPRDTSAFARALADAWEAGPSKSELRLPSWTDVVAVTREMYSELAAAPYQTARVPDSAPPTASAHSGTASAESA